MHFWHSLIKIIQRQNIFSKYNKIMILMTSVLMISYKTISFSHVTKMDIALGTTSTCLPLFTIFAPLILGMFRPVVYGVISDGIYGPLSGWFLYFFLLSHRILDWSFRHLSVAFCETSIDFVSELLEMVIFFVDVAWSVMAAAKKPTVINTYVQQLRKYVQIPTMCLHTSPI